MMRLRGRAGWCLGLFALLLAGGVPAAFGVGVLDDSYVEVDSFSDALGGTTMTLAFDGTSYWSSSGGSPGGVRYAQYDATGAFVASYSPGLDFRSVFTNGNAPPVYARAYASNTIHVQTSPGVFSPWLTLTGGTLDAQSAVVFNDAGTELLAFEGVTVQRWDATSGAFLGSVTLSGFGSLFGEGGYPQNRGVIHRAGHYVTYANGSVSAWDAGGNRVGTGTLVGAGTSFDSHFSWSQANGLAWVVDGAGGAWRGYDVTIVPDETPPTIDLSRFRSLIWNPTRGLVDLGLAVTDDRDLTPTVYVSVWSDEDHGVAPYSPDVTISGATVRCRAERAVPGDGRVYLLHVVAVDDAGNQASACATVVVPMSLVVSSVQAVRAQAAAAIVDCEEFGGAPEGFVLLDSTFPVID